MQKKNIHAANLCSSNTSFSISHVHNDGQLTSLQVLTHLKNLISRQLPNMPLTYITKIVFDGVHEGLVVNVEGKLVGGACYRRFKEQSFSQLVFLAIDHESKGSGLGSRIVNFLKDTLQAKDVDSLLTYADNSAVGFFRKQAFVEVIETQNKPWHGFIKEYEGGTLMETKIHKGFKYTCIRDTLMSQKEYLVKKIRELTGNRVPYSVRNIMGGKKEDQKYVKTDSIENYEKLRLQAIPGALQNSWCSQNQNKLQNSPETSVILQQLYGLESIRQYPLVKQILKTAGQQHFKSISFATIEKKIISGMYSGLFHDFRNDINQLTVNLEQRIEQKELIEELQNKVTQVLSLLKDRKLEIHVEYLFKDSRSKKSAKSTIKK